MVKQYGNSVVCNENKEDITPELLEEIINLVKEQIKEKKIINTKTYIHDVVNFDGKIYGSEVGVVFSVEE